MTILAILTCTVLLFIQRYSPYVLFSQTQPEKEYSVGITVNHIAHEARPVDENQNHGVNVSLTRWPAWIRSQVERIKKTPLFLWDTHPKVEYCTPTRIVNKTAKCFHPYGIYTYLGNLLPRNIWGCKVNSELQCCHITNQELIVTKCSHPYGIYTYLGNLLSRIIWRYKVISELQYCHITKQELIVLYTDPITSSNRNMTSHCYSSSTYFTLSKQHDYVAKSGKVNPIHLYSRPGEANYSDPITHYCTSGNQVQCITTQCGHILYLQIYQTKQHTRGRANELLPHVELTSARKYSLVARSYRQPLLPKPYPPGEISSVTGRTSSYTRLKVEYHTNRYFDGARYTLYAKQGNSLYCRGGVHQTHKITSLSTGRVSNTKVERICSRIGNAHPNMQCSSDLGSQNDAENNYAQNHYLYLPYSFYAVFRQIPIEMRERKNDLRARSRSASPRVHGRDFDTSAQTGQDRMRPLGGSGGVSGMISTSSHLKTDVPINSVYTNKYECPSITTRAHSTHGNPRPKKDCLLEFHDQTYELYYRKPTDTGRGRAPSYLRCGGVHSTSSSCYGGNINCISWEKFMCKEYARWYMGDVTPESSTVKRCFAQPLYFGSSYFSNNQMRLRRPQCCDMRRNVMRVVPFLITLSMLKIATIKEVEVYYNTLSRQNGKITLFYCQRTTWYANAILKYEQEPIYMYMFRVDYATYDSLTRTLHEYK